jgi:cobalt transporter subunit CbtB
VKPAVGDDGEKDLEMNNTAQTKAITRADVSLLPIAFAVLGGLTLLFASGYAQASVLHDAAHDQRHAMAFPCH